MDQTTRDRLVVLRGLFASAASFVNDPTAPGQHLGVIALDGVCEQTLLLAAGELAINVGQRDSVLEIHGKVCGELGNRWSRPGSKAVVELHRSRNNAQHHGVIPRPEFLPRWLVEVDRYVHSLIQVVFAVDLSGVHSSDGVTDPELRAHLVAAEDAVASGDPAAAVAETTTALTRAISLFRSRRRIPSVQSGQSRFREFQQIDAALQELNTFVDVAYFAADPSEWLWLRAISDSNLRDLRSPTLDEARRAFAFGLTWILRWEAFAARHPEPANAEPDALSLDIDYPHPRIVRYDIDDVADDHIGLTVVLDSTPPVWTFNIHRAHAELGEEGQSAGILSAFSVKRDRIALTVSRELSDAQIKTAVAGLIHRVQSMHEALTATHRAVRDKAEAAAAGFERRVAIGGESPIVQVAPLEWSSDLLRAHNDQTAFVTAQVALPNDFNPWDLRQELLDCVPGTVVGINGNWVTFDSSAFPPETFPETLRTAIAKVAATNAEALRYRNERHRLRTDLEQRLNDSPS